MHRHNLSQHPITSDVGKLSDVACGFCGMKEVPLSHILAGCKWVREVENKLHREDRYTWRHNNVLSLLATAIKDVASGIDEEQRASSPQLLSSFYRYGSNARDLSKISRVRQGEVR